MRPFLTRLALFLVLLGILQEFVGRWAPPPIERQLDELATLRPSLLFLGDSSVFRSDLKDVDHRSTAVMLGERRNVTVGSLMGGAQTADLWRHEVRDLLRRGARFDAVVGVINLRSFSPGWDLEPGYQFTAERAFLSLPPYLRPFLKPLVVFGVVDLQPVQETGFGNALVYDGTKGVGQVRDYALAGPASERERRMLLFFYMAKLRADHRKLRSLAELADLLREARVRLLLYVSPIDVEKGTVALGPHFRRQIDENVGTIERALVPRGAEVLDLCCLLPDSHFSYQEYPNEHLTAAGRMAVADALAAKLGSP